MHAPAVMPPDMAAPSLLDPVRGLAPVAGWLGLAAGGAGGAAVLAQLTGWSVAALVGWAACAALGLLALVAAGLSRVQRRRATQDADAVLSLLAADPDCVIVSDQRGMPVGGNAACGGACDPVARLAEWCADPRAVAARLLAQGALGAGASQVFHRADGILCVTLHRLPRNPHLAVWRFARIAGLHPRGADSLAVPVISVSATPGTVVPNAAARALFGAAIPGEDQLLGEGPVVATDGTFFYPHVLPAPGGARDVLLLPRAPVASGLGQRTLDFEELPVALVHLDAAGRIVGSNRLARGLLGLSNGVEHDFWEVVEGLGRPVSDWLEDAQAGRALGRPEVLRATLTGQETFVQIILRRASGLGGDGGLIAVISDATELKSLEARFVQSQKMQAIGQLAGGVAHDFNNLLTAISGHCDLLLLNRDRFDPDYNDLLQIHQNANRAAALVRQLLAFSRKQTLKPEVFGLESLLEDLTHLLKRLVGERITLSLSHDPEIGAIRADRRQLEQVIMNLVVNARDAMPMGGTIRIFTELRHLASEMEHGRARVPAGDYAVIHVADDGLGISPDIIDKIFEPFFTTKKLGEGTGLGLSTAYGIVKQMGGYIFCDSTEGAGTEFTLYFASYPEQPAERSAAGPAGHGEARLSPPPDARPVPSDTGPDDTRSEDPASSRAARDGAGAGDEAADRPDAAASEPAPVPPPAVSGPPARNGAILLVEDEAPVRAFAARALRMQGYQVFEAQDGEEALDFLSDSSVHVDLFVTDVIMPGIDGPGWVTRALETRPGTPVVFVSGYTEDTLSAALGRIPGAVFLGKPFSLRDLSDTISAQLA